MTTYSTSYLANTNIVFVFGFIGAGKTTLLVTLYKYLLENYKVELNSKDNGEGIDYIESLLEQLNNNTLPESTSKGFIKEIDWQVNLTSGLKIHFTFLDMSGEDLKMVREGGLDDEIKKYLLDPNLNVTLLCLIDYDSPARHDRFNHLFFSEIKQVCNFDFSSVGVIVTKWDKNERIKGKKKYQNLKEFMHKNARQTLFWLKDDEMKMKNIFTFSIGKIDSKNPQKLLSIDLKYCERIFNWLSSVAIHQIGVREQQKVEEPVSIKSWLNQNWVVLADMVIKIFKT